MVFIWIIFRIYTRTYIIKFNNKYFYPSKQNTGIYIDNNIHYKNITLLSSKLNISNGENNYGIYLVDSSLLMDYSSIYIKMKKNNNGIYCSEKISLNDDNDDIFIKIMPTNVTIKDNIIKFVKDDEENEEENDDF